MLFWLPTEVWYAHTPKYTDYVSVSKFSVIKLAPKIKYTWESEWYLKIYVYDFDEDFKKLLENVLYIGHKPIVVKTKNSLENIIVLEYSHSIYWNNMDSYIDRKVWGEIFYSINL